VINLTIQRKHAYLIAAFVVIAALLVPAGAWASHQFSDVPDGYWAHGEIDWLKNAGVTQGCGDGSTYCPEDNVKRGEMAAFLQRLATKKVVDAATAVNADNLDGKDSTAFIEHGVIEMTESGTAWMVRSQVTAGPVAVNDRLAHSTVFTGTGWVVIGLTGPGAVGGTNYGLASFDLCLFGSKVTDVAAVAINYFGPTADDAEIYIPVTVQNGAVNRTTGCYTYTVDTPVGQGIGLQVTIDGTVELFSVKTRWTTAAAGP